MRALTGQISLFDVKQKNEPAHKPVKVDPEYNPAEWALVYLVTRRGGYKGNLFILTVQDAQALCSDACSRGIGRGGEWFFMWTTIDHFVRKDDAYGETKHAGTERPKFVFLADTGKQDRDFERLNIQKPTYKQCAEIIHRLGYQIDYTYKRET